MRKQGFVRRSVLMALLFVMGPAAAWAEQDFYGIQIKSEEWARALVLGQGKPDPADLTKGPVVNHAVHAEASLKEVAERRINFRLTVFNDSDAPVPVDYHFRDFLVYTRDGKKYSLIDTEEDLPSSIDPRSKIAFAPSFGNLSISNADVQMIVCSFDLGRTKVILFPWSKKEVVSKLVSPAPPPVPVKEEKKGPVAERKQPKAEEPVKEKVVPESGPRVKTPKRNFWDWLALGKKTRTPEELNREPVMPTAVEPAAPAVSRAAPAAGSDVSPGTKKKLDQAIEGFKYTPAAGTGDPSLVPDPDMPPPPDRSEAQVIDFNRSYNFVTLNVGEQDGLKKGTTLSILRQGKLVAKAKVKQVRAAVSAATLMPGTARSEVRAGDAVSFA